MKWEQTFTERATLVLVGWFIGWFCAGVIALLTLTGCWTSHAVEPLAPVTYKPQTRRWECERIESVAGEVPAQADLAECVDGEPDDYWRCSAHKYEDEARALRDWSLTARAVCGQ